MQRARGFTIVELLIVIVVIAILAALSYVTYTNIQGRAHDAAITSDLVNMGKQVQVDFVQLGALPSATPSALDDIGIEPTKNAYDISHHEGIGEYNLLYCRGSDGASYAFVAWSKSGKGFANINGSVQDFNYAPAVQATTCSRTNAASAYTMTWLFHNGTWRL